jgi:hypothetical protein
MQAAFVVFACDMLTASGDFSQRTIGAQRLVTEALL